MNSERYERVRQIFLAVRGLPATHRNAYLDKACHGDPELRFEVNEFLKEQDAAVGFIDQPALGDKFGLGSLQTQRELDLTPEYIGDYRVIREVGQGGMGVVYLAHDADGRDVAIKVLRPEVVSPDIIARFEHEGRVLARLKHHGMAQIYSVDSFDGGMGVQPFFVMEYVDGEPLLDYAEGTQLTIPERLSLMSKICAAVQYSHQQGVIHRDLKPGNILVDRSGQPKLVDFGIARIVDPDVNAAHTQLKTEAGQVVGTVPYMSPEQCDPDPTAVDTRTDVYSLGVVCYELLTGSLPYDIGDSILQAVRVIPNTLPTPMASHNAFVNDDLEWIVNRALAKLKDDRIQTPQEFGAELGRFARGEELAIPRPGADGLWSKLKDWKVAAGIVVAVVIIVLGAMSFIPPSTPGRAGDAMVVQMTDDLAKAIAQSAPGSEVPAIDAFHAGLSSETVDGRVLYAVALAYTTYGEYTKALNTLDESIARLEDTEHPTTLNAAMFLRENVTRRLEDPSEPQA